MGNSVGKIKEKGDFCDMGLSGKEFLIWLQDEMKNQNEVILRYEDFSFLMEPSGESIEVCSCGKSLGVYASFEDFLSGFSIKGHSFMDVIDELDFGD